MREIQDSAVDRDLHKLNKRRKKNNEGLGFGSLAQSEQDKKKREKFYYWDEAAQGTKYYYEKIVQLYGWSWGEQPGN